MNHFSWNNIHIFRSPSTLAWYTYFKLRPPTKQSDGLYSRPLNGTEINIFSLSIVVTQHLIFFVADKIVTQTVILIRIHFNRKVSYML